jgi:outer membrane protein assembly factor BamB
MRARALFSVVVVCLTMVGSLGPLLVQAAPHAVPATPAKAEVLDLAAMALRPQDVPEPGYGLWSSQLVTPEDQAQGLNEAKGGSKADFAKLVQQLEDAGWQRGQQVTLGVVKADDPNQISAGVTSMMVQFADADGAAKGFTLLEDETGIKDVTIQRAGRVVGDQSQITIDRHLAHDPTQPQVNVDLTFRTGNMVATVFLTNFSSTTPDTSKLEPLATTLLQRVQAVQAGTAGPGLSLRVTRLGGEGIVTYSDHYDRIGAVTLPYAGETTTATTARDDSFQANSVTDDYYVSQTSGSTDNDQYILYTLDVQQFSDEQTATTWLQNTPSAFIAQPGTGVKAAQVSGAATVGDGSAMVSYSYARSDKTTAAGYSMYLRVGSVGATVQLDGVPNVSRSAVEQLATDQAACLANGPCLQPVSLPSARPQAPAPPPIPPVGGALPTTPTPVTEGTPVVPAPGPLGSISSPVASAVPFDANGQWSKLASILPAGGQDVVDYPVIAGRADGSMIAVWFDGHSSGPGGEQLLWAVLPSNAQTWKVMGPVHADAYGDSNQNEVYAPDLLALPDGSMVVGWAIKSDQGYGLRMSTLPAGADAWSAPAPVADADSDARFLSLAVGPDGPLYAVWQGFAPGTTQGGGTPIFSWRPPGGEWQPSVKVRSLPPRLVGKVSTGGYFPELAIDADGRVVLIWKDDEETLTETDRNGFHLMFSVWEPATKSWAKEAPVVPADPGGFDSAARGAMIGTANGIQLVGFLPAASKDANARLALTTLPSGGATWTKPAAITDSQVKPNDPRLHATADGTLVLTWGIQSGGNSVNGAFLPAGATDWVDLPPAFKGQSYFTYDSALTADGRLGVVIAQNTSASGIPAMVTFYTPGGPGSTTPAGATPQSRPEVTEPTPESIFRGNAARTGTQPGPGPTSNLKELWRWFAQATQQRYADQMSAPVLVDGVIYVGTGLTGADHGGLHAVDAATGKPLWSYRTNRPVGTAVAVADGVVYAVDAAFDTPTKLYAVDAKTGKELWQAPASWYSAPVVVAGLVYASTVSVTEHKIVAYDAKTGKVVWDAKVPQLINSSPAVADGVLYIGGALAQEGNSFPGVLYAFDAKTGKKLWQVKTSQTVDTTPAVYGGMVYFADHGGILYAVNAKTGEITWQTESMGFVHSPAVTHGVVYVASGSGVLHALDSLTGKELWSTDVGTPLGDPVVAGNAVYVPGQRSFYVFDAKTGKQLAKIDPLPIGLGANEVSAVVADGVIYVNGQGALLALGGQTS